MTKKEKIYELIEDIPYVMDVKEETINKMVARWSNKGLNELLNLHHEFYEDKKMKHLMFAVLGEYERNVNIWIVREILVHERKYGNK